MTSPTPRDTNHQRPRQVIGDAHQICAYMGAKHTEADAVQLAMHDNTTLTEANAQTLIESAEGMYCPQLGRRGVWLRSGTESP